MKRKSHLHGLKQFWIYFLTFQFNKTKNPMCFEIFFDMVISASSVYKMVKIIRVLKIFLNNTRCRYLTNNVILIHIQVDSLSHFGYIIFLEDRYILGNIDNKTAKII